MTTATEHPIATAPDDGSEFQVRIGARWFAGAYRADAETGEILLTARLSGDEWWPVTADAWRPVKAKRIALPAVPASRSKPRVIVWRGEGEPPIPFPEFKDRMTRMVKTLRAMNDTEWRFLSAGQRINWPATVDSAEDRRAQAENHSNRDAPPARFKPSPADMSQLDESCRWFLALDPLPLDVRREIIRFGRQPLSDAQRLIWMDALGASARTIAKQLGVSDDTARNRTNAAWDRLWHLSAEPADAAPKRRTGDRLRSDGGEIHDF